MLSTLHVLVHAVVGASNGATLHVVLVHAVAIGIGIRIGVGVGVGVSPVVSARLATHVGLYRTLIRVSLDRNLIGMTYPGHSGMGSDVGSLTVGIDGLTIIRAPELSQGPNGEHGHQRGDLADVHIGSGNSG